MIKTGVIIKIATTASIKHPKINPTMVIKAIISSRLVVKEIIQLEIAAETLVTAIIQPTASLVPKRINMGLVVIQEPKKIWYRSLSFRSR